MDELAIASVPIQKWSTPDETPIGLLSGSIFEELRKPFFIEEEMAECCCKADKGSEASLRRIQQAQFFLMDLQMYLDTHPHAEEAKTLKKEYQQKCKEMMAEFAKEYYPLTMQCEGEEAKAEIPWEGGREHVAL